MWLTGKNKSGDADSDAQLQVEETDGLLVLAGATPSVDETASITVDDEIAGNVTITVSAAAAKKLVPTTTGVWDVQMRDAAGNFVTLAHGALKVVADVTQRIE